MLTNAHLPPNRKKRRVETPPRSHVHGVFTLTYVNSVKQSSAGGEGEGGGAEGDGGGGDGADRFTNGVFDFGGLTKQTALVGRIRQKMG